MNVYDPMFMLPALFGLIFLICGALLRKYPPGHKGMVYGYRSSRAMKSPERWNFAQRYSGSEFMKFGSLLILLSIVGLFLSIEESVEIFIAIALIILAIVMVLTRTENALKRKFERES